MKITDFQLSDKSGKTGGVVIVSFGNGYTGYYAHARLLNGVKIGDFIPRGKAFATVVDARLGSPCSHLSLIKSTSLDPYDYMTELRVPHCIN